jgi:hypothetical protein
VGAEPTIPDERVLFVAGGADSGATLMARMLDAQPGIVCAGHLVPTALPPPRALLEALEGGLALTGGRYRGVGRALRESGQDSVGVFFARCRQAGVTVETLRGALEALAEAMAGGVRNWRQRLELAWRLMCARRVQAGAEVAGLKVPPAALDRAGRLFPNARLIGVVRDPLDVVASARARGAEQTVPELARVWARCVQTLVASAERWPERCVLARYEDLVRSPRRTQARIHATLGLPTYSGVGWSPGRASAGDPLLRVPRGAAGWLHASAGLGRGRATLDTGERALVESLCVPHMRMLGYDNDAYVMRDPAPSLAYGRSARPEETLELTPATMLQKRAEFSRKKRYSVADYEALLAPYMGRHQAMRLCDFVRLEDMGDARVLLIRHDVDHDLETAVRLGEWERARGLQSTFCVLHTAWYYGALRGGRYQHSDKLLSAIERLAALGHEVNLHNNLVALALREDVSPEGLLAQELEFFDRLGVPIVGTSTHGDALCRQLEFRNWELFSECCDGRFGGPRDVSYRLDDGQHRSVSLGRLSMLDFGLEYEAYDIARDVYHTDSGGTLRTLTAVEGRRPFGRDGDRGEVVGILTHPIWWAF